MRLLPRRKILGLGVFLVVVLDGWLLTPSAVQAQFPPDSLTNLQVLPKDIETRALINTMRGFAIGLGVRCQFCHVGEEGMPLSEFDFAADQKPTKLKARRMLKMVSAINDEHLAGLENRTEPNVTVTCATCHRGQSRPQMIQDVLRQALDQGGLDGAVGKYRELREEYYGSYTFDFTEDAINDLAIEVGRQRQFDDALGLLRLNLEFFPESASIYFFMGEFQLAQADTSAAVASYQRSMELMPDNRGARRRLQQLGRE